MIVSIAIPTRLRLAPAVATAALALVSVPSVVASAEPQEWDIETYDNCMKKTVRDPEYCCVMSGGIVGRVPGSCTAPAAVAQDPAAESTPGNKPTTQVSVPPQATFQVPRAPAANSG